MSSKVIIFPTLSQVSPTYNETISQVGKCNIGKLSSHVSPTTCLLYLCQCTNIRPAGSEWERERGFLIAKKQAMHARSKIPPYLSLWNPHTLNNCHIRSQMGFKLKCSEQNWSTGESYLASSYGLLSNNNHESWWKRSLGHYWPLALANRWLCWNQRLT